MNTRPVTILLFHLLRWTMRPWLFHRYRVVVTGDRSLRTLRPPFVVLANHVNFWDPFLIAFAFSHPVHFVAADGNFRSRIMRTLMRAAGAVPKAKVRNDMDSIRSLRTLVQNGNAVALFPEGQRTWDGTARPVLPGADKLLRILGAPVVAVRLKGAYLSKPRWARRIRRGLLEIELRTLLSAQELSTIPRAELPERIVSGIAFDENHALFVGRRRAERAETVLFLCPACGVWDSLVSEGDSLRCSHCGESTWFAPSGRLFHVVYGHAPSGDATYRRHRFPNLAAWNKYQLARLKESVQAHPQTQAPAKLDWLPAPLPCRVEHATLLTGYRTRPLRHRGTVRLDLTHEKLRITPTVSGTSPAVELPVREITGINVQYTHQLEFYARRRLYILRFSPPGPSAYRLEQTLLYCQSND